MNDSILDVGTTTISTFKRCRHKRQIRFEPATKPSVRHAMKISFIFDTVSLRGEEAGFLEYWHSPIVLGFARIKTDSTTIPFGLHSLRFLFLRCWTVGPDTADNQRRRPFY
jgi:hypothetical protein